MERVEEKIGESKRERELLVCYFRMGFTVCPEVGLPNAVFTQPRAGRQREELRHLHMQAIADAACNSSHSPVC